MVYAEISKSILRTSIDQPVIVRRADRIINDKHVLSGG